jgi:hypothetical protein
MLTPAFSEKYLRKYFGTVSSKTSEMLKAWGKAMGTAPDNEVEAHGE